MIIDIRQKGSAMTIAFSGRMDSAAAEEADNAVQQNIDGVTKLTFDFSELEYLSSAGLRILLGAQKIMNQQGEMEIINVNEGIRDVFAMTGMLDIFVVDP